MIRRRGNFRRSQHCLLSPPARPLPVPSVPRPHPPLYSPQPPPRRVSPPSRNGEFLRGHTGGEGEVGAAGCRSLTQCSTLAESPLGAFFIRKRVSVVFLRQRDLSWAENTLQRKSLFAGRYSQRDAGLQCPGSASSLAAGTSERPQISRDFTRAGEPRFRGLSRARSGEMKGKLLGEVAVQFDRLQRQQQRRPVPGSSASRLPLCPRAPGCPRPTSSCLSQPGGGGRRRAGTAAASSLVSPKGREQHPHNEVPPPS